MPTPGNLLLIYLEVFFLEYLGFEFDSLVLGSFLFLLVFFVLVLLLFLETRLAM